MNIEIGKQTGMVNTLMKKLANKIKIFHNFSAEMKYGNPP